MLSEVNEDRMASWYIASAPFARYDCLPEEQKSDKAAAELIEQIENAAENMNPYQTQRSNRGRNRNGRQEEHFVTQETAREPCPTCGKMHAGGLANC